MSGAEKRCAQTTKAGSQCKRMSKHVVDGNVSLCTMHYTMDREIKKAPDCPICLAPIVRREMATTTCSHSYHTRCLNRWLRRGSTACPTCRGTIENPFRRQQRPTVGVIGAVPIDLRHLLDMMIHLTPTTQDERVYPYALVQQITNPIMSQYLPTDPDVREVIVEVAFQSTSANVFIRVLEDMRII